MTEEMQLFLEDMDEQLSFMEEALLDLSESSLENVDKELVNKLFRAMHTMKGNAGIFGYELIVEFAHIAESLLDEIRNQRIILSHEMLEVFLLVKDHSKHLIEVSIHDENLDENGKRTHHMLIERLLFFLDTEIKSENSKELVEKKSKAKNYCIKVSLKDDFFISGMDMLSIIRYLDAIGEVKDVVINCQPIPKLDQLNPLKSYLSLKIFYSTEEIVDEIVEAFEFVEDDVELDIQVLDEVIEEKKVEESSKEFVVFKKTPKKKNEDENQEFVVFKKTKKDEKKNLITPNSFTLKVDSLKIDRLINQISEMVIANAKITQYSLKSNDTELEEAVGVMSDMLEEVRNGIMNIRMVQVGDSFSKLRRIVSDSAKKMDKEIGFEIIGGETELDKSVIEKILDPLVHMLRNSVDHGIEKPEIREQKGKPKKGNIVLKAYPDSGSIVIEIADDGNGMDKDVLFKKAVEKGLIKPNERLNEDEILHLIFMPGFSTANEISDISGRGVGMDVVKRNIEDLRGTIDIDSVLNQGTTFTIRLPLTLAIIDGFLVQVANSKYIIPLDNIQECIELTKKAKEQMASKGYITLRSNILPVLDIAKHFGLEENTNKRENIVVVQYGKSQVGLKVDELFGEFQTVIKPLGEVFEKVSGISAGTILGDGEVALIFDIQKLIEHKIMHKENKNGN